MMASVSGGGESPALTVRSIPVTLSQTDILLMSNSSPGISCLPSLPSLPKGSESGPAEVHSVSSEVSVTACSSTSEGRTSALQSEVVSTSSPAVVTVSTKKLALSPMNSVPVLLVGQGANSTKSQTAIQLSSDSQSKELLKCDECEYSTLNKHYLKQHVDLVHSDIRPYKCPFCDYAGKRSHSLKEHLVVHSKDRPYECHLCNATFRKKGHLTNHIKMHSPSSSLQVLGGNVCSPDSLAEGEGSIFICAQCEFASTSKTIFMNHLSSCSKKVVSETGQSCETSWVTVKESAIAGVQSPPTAVPSIAPNTPVVLMKCTECGFTSSDKDLLKKHMWVHLSQPSSNSCPKTSTVQAQINPPDVQPQPKQAQDQHASTSFKCGECLHETKEAYKFIAHMLTHKASPKTESTSLIKASVDLKVPNDPVKEAPAPNSQTRKTAAVDSSGFTHDKSVGRFCCNICGYTCDYQRTIKAHVWKHSGHKDIDYPMFQNGPMSIYDEVGQEDSVSLKATPTTIASAKSDVCTTGEKSQKNDELVPKSVNGVQTVDAAAISGAVMKLLNPKPSPTVSLSKCDVTSANGFPSNGDHSFVKVVVTSTGNVSNSAETEPVWANVNALATLQNISGDGSVHENPGLRTVQLEETTIKSLFPEAFTSAVLALSGDNLTNSPSKRPLSQSISDLSAADASPTKKLCTEADKSSPNVVVERVNVESQLSTFTGLRSQQNSPRGQEMLSSAETPVTMECISPSEMETGEEDSQSLSTKSRTLLTNETKKLLTNPAETSFANPNHVVFVAVSDPSSVSLKDKDNVWTKAEISKLIASGKLQTDVVQTAIETQKTHTEEGKLCPSISVHDESALTLLSLLQKGVQSSVTDSGDSVLDGAVIDTAEIGVQLPDLLVEVREEQVISVDEGSQTIEDNGKDVLSSSEVEDQSESNKPKAGICSSLLAVIEQLRERSKSESETDDGSQLNMLVKRKPRRRNQRNSRDTPFQVESLDNVEKLEDLEIKYRCKLCHYTNSSPPLIKQHMRLHKTKKPFECSLCDFVADSSETLQDHMIQHCKMRTYQCKLCPSAFNYKSQLRAHMRAHSEKDPFLCDSCDFETTNPITFRNHTRMHSDKSLLRCDECGSFLSDKNDLSVHKRTGCKASGVLICEICAFDANSEEELKEHQKSHKHNLQCPQCDLVCPSQASLRIHARAHEEAKDMKCELCSFLAASSRSLKSHMKRHINDQRYVQQPLEQYKCNLCGYVCHHLPSLKSHMWRHASDKNYIYEFTNEVINAAIDYDSRQDNPSTTAKTSTSDLKANSADMNDDTALPDLPADGVKRDRKIPCLITFRCCQCGFETISKSDLNQHMKMHSDIIRKTLEVSKTLSQSGLSAKRVHVETIFNSSPNNETDDCSLMT